MNQIESQKKIAFLTAEIDEREEKILRLQNEIEHLKQEVEDHRYWREQWHTLCNLYAGHDLKRIEENG